MPPEVIAIGIFFIVGVVAGIAIGIAMDNSNR